MKKIIIKGEPRQGWAEAASQLQLSDDDRMLFPDIFNNEYFSHLSW